MYIYIYIYSIDNGNCLNSYYPKQKSKRIIYFDANNLYMSKLYV